MVMTTCSCCSCLRSLLEQHPSGSGSDSDSDKGSEMSDKVSGGCDTPTPSCSSSLTCTPIRIIAQCRFSSMMRTRPQVDYSDMVSDIAKQYQDHKELLIGSETINTWAHMHYTRSKVRADIHTRTHACAFTPWSASSTLPYSTPRVCAGHSQLQALARQGPRGQARRQR